MAAAPLVRIGVVARPHGVRGELKLALDNKDSDLLTPGLTIHVTPRGGKARATEIVDVKGGAIVRLRDVPDREAADALRGALVEVDRAALPSLSDEESYLVDLLGAALVDGGGRALGVIESFTDNGAQPLASVRTPSGALVEMPFVPGLLVSIDAAAGRVVAAPPIGLFEGEPLVDERGPAALDPPSPAKDRAR